MPKLALLGGLLRHVPERLANLSEGAAESKRTATAWSPKEELGHLLDSAANNHQRLVRAQFEDNLAMPGYEQNHWVAVHDYQHRDWKELIEAWEATNRQLLAAAKSVPDEAWANKLTVATSAPMTLQFVFDDYVDHMVHHLKHIGIETDDIASNAMTAA